MLTFGLLYNYPFAVGIRANFDNEEKQMKKIVMICLLIGGFTQAAVAAEPPSPFYLGVGGVGLSNEIGMTNQEAVALSQSQANGSTRNVSAGRYVKDFFIGYHKNDWAVELEYFGFDPGARSNVSGVYPWFDQNMQPATTSFAYAQKTTTSGWGVSVLKEHSLDQSVKVFGRLGLMTTTTDTEQRWAYTANCSTCINDGSYQAKSSSTSTTSVQFGIGISAKVYENFDVRAEVRRSSAFNASTPTVTALSLLYHL